MGFLRLFVAIFLASIVNFAAADVFEAWDFRAIDGDIQKNIDVFDSAKAIQEKLGVKVDYWQHDVNGDNVVSYVLRFADLAEWAAFKDAAMNNSEWAEWISTEWPKLRPHLVASYAMTNVLNPEAGKDITDGHNVGYWNAWEARENHTSAELLASIQKSTAISQKFGIETNTYTSGPEGIFYVFNTAENFVEFEKKFAERNASKEWIEYWTQAQENRVGRFVRQSWITRVQ